MVCFNDTVQIIFVCILRNIHEIEQLIHYCNIIKFSAIAAHFQI